MVKNGKILRSLQYIASRISVVVCGADGIYRQFLAAAGSHIVLLCKPGSRSVTAYIGGGSICCLQGDFRLAVAVIVPHLELCVMSAGSDIHAHVNTP